MRNQGGVILISRESVAPEWVVVSEGRQSRPITGGGRTSCPFCPGPDAEVGSDPFSVAVFDNRFPPFQGRGGAAVVVYSADHDDDLAYLPLSRADLVWRVWEAHTLEWGRRADVAQVFVFENRGARVGASITHPHGQIYGYPELSPRLARERTQFLAPVCPICRDLAAGRLILAVSGWRVMAPPVPRMPFEVWLTPASHSPTLVGLGETDRRCGAALMQAVVRAYDDLFGHRTPLMTALYQDVDPIATYHWRLDFLPIERAPGRYKFLAASEVAMDAFLTDVGPTTTAAAMADRVRRRFHEAWPSAERG
jgi:UDPglucose--hexose-1-phosphate uridylyltransferase